MTHIAVNETQSPAGELVREAVLGGFGGGFPRYGTVSTAVDSELADIFPYSDVIVTAVVRDAFGPSALPAQLRNRVPPTPITCSIVWRTDQDLQTLLSNWDRLILSALRLSHRSVNYERSVNGVLHQASCNSFADASVLVPNDLAAKHNIGAELHILLNVDGVVLEINYCPESAPTLVASFLQVPLPGFAKFFTLSHESFNVRTNGEIAARLFNRDAAVISDPLDILSPTPLV